MTFDCAKPCNELPVLSPVVEVESRAVLKACIAARAAVAELKAAGRLMRNQGVLINSVELLKRDGAAEHRHSADGSTRTQFSPSIDPHVHPLHRP